ncbi:MAG: YqaE/Pmp3 family membrane protein [Synechococcales cyanobacterium T60_A2020_003]|nr:YqaE/Pmp3 family membrane protein [Synechococcales cyanobacterium T60_A2020_003]
MNNVLRIILGILLPPVGVFLTYGLSTTLLINILLTLLGWLPGSIHAVWAIAKQMEKQREEFPST